MSVDEPKNPPKDPFPLYPVAIAVFPVFAVFSANQTLFPLSDLGRPFALAAVGSLLLLGLGLLLTRDRRRGAALAGCLAAWLWTYDSVAPALEPMVGFDHRRTAWALLGLMLAAILARIGPPIRPLNVVAGLILVVSVGQVGVQALGGPANPSAKQAQREIAALPPGPRPDVFWIVLDGFGREDVLREVMGANVGEFTEALRQRGFQVADQARSNYVQTELSLASSMNLETLQTLLGKVEHYYGDRELLQPLTAEPKVARWFQASGYRYLALGSGFQRLNLGRYALPLPDSRTLTLLEGTLLPKTPFGEDSTMVTSQFDAHRNRIAGVLDRLEDLAEPLTTPRLVFAHILCPHPPFVFGPNGEPKRPRGPFGYWDASDYLDQVGDAETYREGYRDQVKFLSQRILAVVDTLKAANPANPPVIILQGDHGSKVGLKQNQLEGTDLREAFSILYAVHVPPNVAMRVPPNATPINTFRRLLTALGAQGLPELPERSYYSPYARPFEFSDVTDRLNSFSTPQTVAPGRDLQ